MVAEAEEADYVSWDLAFMPWWIASGIAIGEWYWWREFGRLHLRLRVVFFYGVMGPFAFREGRWIHRDETCICGTVMTLQGSEDGPPPRSFWRCPSCLEKRWVEE